MDLEFEAHSLANKAMDTLHPNSTFIPGVSQIPVTGKVFGGPEIQAAINASMAFWLTSGPYTESFESRFAKVVGEFGVIGKFACCFNIDESKTW